MDSQDDQGARARFPFDQIYKALCCHRQTVADMLGNYLAEPAGPLAGDLVDALDLGSLRKLSTEWVTREFQIRRGDQVWRADDRDRVRWRSARLGRAVVGDRAQHRGRGTARHRCALAAAADDRYSLDLPGMEELLAMEDVTVLSSRLDETIEAWRRDAVSEGQRALLCRQTAQRFGAAAGERLEVLLRGTDDSEQIVMVGERIIDAKAEAELFERIAALLRK